MQPTLRYGRGDVELLEDVQVFRGHYAVHRLTLKHRQFAGDWSKPLTREVFHRGDAVGVLPWDPRSDSVILLEQFRPGALRDNDSPWMLELVAGVVEAGESDEDVVAREALEEADCQMDRLVSIASFFPSAGACSEQVRLFCGRLVRAGVGGIHGHAAEGEDILVHQVSRQEALALLARDQVPNGHTLIALQWLQIHGDGLREQWLDDT